MALGLASGFVEPLESTSIHLIMIAVTRLIQRLPVRRRRAAPIVERFNAQAAREIEGIRDFIILHYHLTERDDSDSGAIAGTWRFRTRWRSASRCSATAATPIRHRDELFRVDSWVQVMLGQRLTPLRYHPAAQIIPEAQLKGVIGGAEEQYRPRRRGDADA